MHDADYHLSKLVMNPLPHPPLNPTMVLILGGKHTCTPRWSDPRPLVNDFYKIYHPVAGAAQVHCGSTALDLRPGWVYFLPAGQPLRNHCDHRMEVLWVHFRPQSPTLNLHLRQLSSPVSFTPRQTSGWRDALHALEHLPARTDLPDQLRIGALLQDLTARLLAQAPPWPDPGWRERLDRLRPALRWMDEHFRTNPPLEELARLAHLSPTYFQRCFTQLLGCSPHRYMLQRRLELARHLLRTTALPVGEVAQACGYDNLFYFSRIFRQHSGCSASEYRQGQGTTP